MIDKNIVLDKLAKSTFRTSFKLKEKDKKYVNEKGMDTIRKHAYDFVNRNIRVKLEKDGKQTPTHGHPIFIGEHATATCCRKCVYKWYGIRENRELTNEEVDYFVDILMEWVKREMKK